jgi:hypothetical protein
VRREHQGKSEGCYVSAARNRSHSPFDSPTVPRC